MNKEEFHEELFKQFTVEELGKINEKIYSNPIHIDYYKNYHSNEFKICLEYLNTNRELLTLKK